MGGIP